MVSLTLAKENIVSALFRVMKQYQGAANVVTFIEKATRGNYFPRYHNTLDRVLRTLRQNGIGIERK